MASHLRMQPARKPAAKNVHALNDSAKTDSTAQIKNLLTNPKLVTDSATTAKDNRAVASPRIPVDTTTQKQADSLKTDSVKPRPGIDSPVEYQAQDSMVYDAATGLALLYGQAQVDYQNMQLTAAKISMNMDSSLVHAEARPDSTAEGGIKGKPVFKMGSDEYDTDTIKFNFKSKKALINNVYTLLIRAFLLLKLNLMVSVSYSSLPILKTGFPFIPPSAVESGRASACTKLESMFIEILAAVSCIF